MEKNYKQKLLTWQEWQELTGWQPVVRNYKDTVFRMLHKDKRTLLSLYNGINDTNHDNPDDLEIVTLENAIYMKFKNDVACVVDFNLDMYEQQSTANPNMPLRYLGYVSRVFEKLIVDDSIYSSRRIMLPTPKFVVFYNGEAEQPAYREYRLSDAFIQKTERPNLELIVTQININPGYNDDLMNKCPDLFQYMQYVSKIREYHKDMPLALAVNKAVDDCIDENILRDFLLQNKAEVVNMSIFEYDEEKHLKSLREESREDGRTEGRAEGRAEGFTEGEIKTHISLICRKLKKQKTPETIADELEEENLDYIKNICDIANEFAPEYDIDKIYEKVITLPNFSI